MDQQVKDKLCKQIDTEIEKIANMPSLNDTTLANLYKLIDVKKDLLEIEEKEMELGMDEYQGGYSMRQGGGGSSNAYRGGGGQGGGSNRGGGQGGGGNSRRGPIYYDDGYSMNGSYAGGGSYDRMPEMQNEREMVRRQMMNTNMY